MTTTTPPITRTDTRTLTRWFDREAAAGAATITEITARLEAALAAHGYAAAYERAGARMTRDRAADIADAWMTANGITETDYITAPFGTTAAELAAAARQTELS